MHMFNDLMYFIISNCCGSRQGRERRHIHDIIDDIEQLAEEEFEKLYHKYTCMRRQKVHSPCC